MKKKKAVQSATMFLNIRTWTLSAVWSCCYYREGLLVKHRDCLYNIIATVTSNRCHDYMSYAAVKFIIVLTIVVVLLGVCICDMWTNQDHNIEHLVLFEEVTCVIYGHLVQHLPLFVPTVVQAILHWGVFNKCFYCLWNEGLLVK